MRFRVTAAIECRGDEICNSIDMSRFGQGTAANNDPLFNCRNVRSVIISENSDKRTISEEMFKKLVGGDKIDVSAKYVSLWLSYGYAAAELWLSCG